MIILGVDPGTQRTGIGVIESQGNRYKLLHTDVIKIPSQLSIPEKLQRIHEGILSCLKTYQPDTLALENIFYSKNVRSMLRIGEARASVMLAAADQGIPVVEYPPARVKQAVTGNGRASKEQIQSLVKTLLSLKEAPPSDAADALAIGICHLHCHKYQQVVDQANATVVR